MDQKLVINISPTEKRIALLENNQVTEILIEREEQRSSVGNIYRGVVSRVLPGMNCAFVKVGLERAAFLYGRDILDPTTPPSSSLVDAETFLEEDLSVALSLPPQKPIDQMLHEGQSIVVQVLKEPLGTKGPRISMHLSLPGRYLVLLPRISHMGISRRIESEAERKRLRESVQPLLPPQMGVIVRTAAQGVSEAEISQDLLYLIKAWQTLEKKITEPLDPTSKGIGLLYADLPLQLRVVRDWYCPEVSEIVVDSRKAYKELHQFLLDTLPLAVDKLRLHKDPIPVFDLYDIELDLAGALDRKVILPSGGHLIVDQTEALTSFDVNTGKFVGTSNARETIFKTNLEAAKKVAEQLRLRNIGGIIIIDFIDCETDEDRETLFAQFQQELKRDRARTHVLRISELGLVQMTRKRTADSLGRQLLQECPYCMGNGQVRRLETEGTDLLREVRRISLQTGEKNVNIHAREDLIHWVKTHEHDALASLQDRQGLHIRFTPSSFQLEMLRESQYEVSVEK